MKYFKIVYGYNEPDYLPISEDELPKAITLFIEGVGRGIFRAGAIRGQDIIRIVPDWHADQKWNRGWKMQPEDYEAIKHLEGPYQKTYKEAEMIAEIALKENRRELLSQPLKESVKILPKYNSSISEAVKQLSDKFKIK